jgi:hypothetical protein
MSKPVMTSLPQASSRNSNETLETPLPFRCRCTALAQRAWRVSYGDKPCDGTLCASRQRTEGDGAPTPLQSQMFS